MRIVTYYIGHSSCGLWDLVWSYLLNLNYVSIIESVRYKFLRKLNSPEGQTKANNFVENHSTEGDVDDMTADFISLLKWAAENSTSVAKKKKKKSKKNDKNPWYDDECRKMKGCLNRAVKRFRNDPFNRGAQDEVFVARHYFMNQNSR